MDEDVLDPAGLSQVVLGKRKQSDAKSPAKTDYRRIVSGFFADDIEDLYASDDLPMDSDNPRGGDGAVIPRTRDTPDEYEDFGEQVFADNESDGEDSVASAWDGATDGKQPIGASRGMGDDDDNMTGFGEDATPEKVSTPTPSTCWV